MFLKDSCGKLVVDIQLKFWLEPLLGQDKTESTAFLGAPWALSAPRKAVDLKHINLLNVLNNVHSNIFQKCQNRRKRYSRRQLVANDRFVFSGKVSSLIMSDQVFSWINYSESIIFSSKKMFYDNFACVFFANVMVT